MLTIKRPHPLFASQGWAFFNPCLWAFCCATKCRKAGKGLFKIHRIIAPLSGGDHAAIQIQNALNFRAVK